MADFELNINSRAFANRDVQLLFNENKYGELIDSLAETVPVDATPRVELAPAPVWGMSKTREIINTAARNDEIFPQGSYYPTTHSLALKVGKDQDQANRLLLDATRRWSSDVSGDLAAYDAYAYRRRNMRRGTFLATTGLGAVAGLEVGNEAGAIVGGAIGLLVGMGAEIADTHRSPYQRQIREFVKDPAVIAEWGHIIVYRALR